MLHKCNSKRAWSVFIFVVVLVLLWIGKRMLSFVTIFSEALRTVNCLEAKLGSNCSSEWKLSVFCHTLDWSKRIGFICESRWEIENMKIPNSNLCFFQKLWQHAQLCSDAVVSDPTFQPPYFCVLLSGVSPPGREHNRINEIILSSTRHWKWHEMGSINTAFSLMYKGV